MDGAGLIDNKIIKRFINGFYTTENFQPELLCQKIYPQSYISLSSILSKKLIIGSIPKKAIYAVKLGRKKELDNGELKLRYFSISKELFFGWKVKNGIKYASNEKAFVDLLYYYQRGLKLSFNIYSDVNSSLLQPSKIRQILKKYKNKKFCTFVSKVLESYEY